VRISNPAKVFIASVGITMLLIGGPNLIRFYFGPPRPIESQGNLVLGTFMFWMFLRLFINDFIVYRAALEKPLFGITGFKEFEWKRGDDSGDFDGPPLTLKHKTCCAYPFMLVIFYIFAVG
jgi:hypothetical protein